MEVPQVPPVLPVPLIEIVLGVLDKVTQGILGGLVFLDVLSTSVVPI